jgi:endonuclease III-like uncharacterized protein
LTGVDFSKGGNMETETKKEIYVEPEIIATYTKQELEETIRPHGFNGVISPVT